MYEVVRVKSGTVISRHRTLEAAKRARLKLRMQSGFWATIVQRDRKRPSR